MREIREPAAGGMGKAKKLRPSLEAAAASATVMWAWGCLGHVCACAHTCSCTLSPIFDLHVTGSAVFQPRAVVDPHLFKKSKSGGLDKVRTLPGGAQGSPSRLKGVLDPVLTEARSTPVTVSPADAAEGDIYSSTKKKKKTSSSTTKQQSVMNSSDKFAHEPIMQLGTRVSSAAAITIPDVQRAPPPAVDNAPPSAVPGTSAPLERAQGVAGADSLAVTSPRRSGLAKQGRLFSRSPLAKQQNSAGNSPAVQRSLKAADTEYNAVWPQLSKSDRQEAIQRLSNVLEPLRALNLERRRAARVQRLMAVKRRPGKLDSSSMLESSDDSETGDGTMRGGCSRQVQASTEARVLQGLVRVGLNQVTRTLEGASEAIKCGGKVSLVLVCRDAQPAMLVQHLLWAACLRGVRACATGETSAGLGSLLGIPSALALAFLHPEPVAPCALGEQRNARNDAATAAESVSMGLASLVQFICSRAPPASLPWLPSPAPDAPQPARNRGMCQGQTGKRTGAALGEESR